MFDWFWEFLYMLSKTIFRLIDGLVLCANMLCGVEPITFEGEETDLLTYLFFSDEIGYAFKVSAVLATMLVVIFTVFMIIRTIGKEKAEGTPVQLSMKAFKTILMFFLVPAVMIAFMAVGNTFLSAIYKSTMRNSSSPGAFLFSAFAKDGGMNPAIADKFATGEFDYTNTDLVWDKLGESGASLSDFPFLFSWLAGGVVLFGIASAMLIFVDRVLSLVILYIASPVSISTCVIDDGARFKLWRDQFLSKFIMGYGMIISLNIYALVCSLIMNPEFVFFPDSGFLDLIMKLLIIGGGAFTMQKSMALIGNLVASGAGSNELRDNAFSAGRLASMAAGVAKNTIGLPAKFGAGILRDAWSQQTRHLGARLLGGLGMDGGYGKDKKKGDKDSSKEDSGSKNDAKANYGSDQDSTKKAINGDGFKRSFGGGDNANNNKNDSKKNNALGNAINGGGTGQNKQGGDGK